jgi:hypothetical protein
LSGVREQQERQSDENGDRWRVVQIQNKLLIFSVNYKYFNDFFSH